MIWPEKHWWCSSRSLLLCNASVPGGTNTCQRNLLLWLERRDGGSPRNWCQLQPRRGDRWSRCSRSRPQEKQYCESESDNSSKKRCRPEHHKKESEDAKPFLSSLGRQERLRCSWHLSQSAKICPIIVILKSCNLKIILIINHPESGFLRILSSTPPMKPSGSDQNCCGLTVDRLITNGPATRISAMRWWGTGRTRFYQLGWYFYNHSCLEY